MSRHQAAGRLSCGWLAWTAVLKRLVGVASLVIDVPSGSAFPRTRATVWTVPVGLERDLVDLGPGEKRHGDHVDDPQQDQRQHQDDPGPRPRPHAAATAAGRRRGRLPRWLVRRRAGRRRSLGVLPGGSGGRRRSDDVVSPREREVLGELARGATYADIGETLFVSANTVKTHVSSLYTKLGASRRSEALA